MVIDFNSPYVKLVRAIMGVADAMDAGDRERAQACMDQAERLVEEIAAAQSSQEQDG